MEVNNKLQIIPTPNQKGWHDTGLEACRYAYTAFQRVSHSVSEPSYDDRVTQL